MILETERLILRYWQDRDRAPYVAINADPVVRQYFHPHRRTAKQVNAFVDEMIADHAANGFGFLVLERKSDGAFIGELGLGVIDQPTRNMMARPADVEIGWMLGREFWGNGYATEAGVAVLDHSWRHHDFPELIAFTYVGNLQSRRLMQRLGMTEDPQSNFEDPSVPFGHWQRPHVIYRIANPRLATPAALR